MGHGELQVVLFWGVIIIALVLVAKTPGLTCVNVDSAICARLNAKSRMRSGRRTEGFLLGFMPPSAPVRRSSRFVGVSL